MMKSYYSEVVSLAPPAAADPAYLVFCDVDETLITCDGMVDFLGYYCLKQRGERGAAIYRQAAVELGVLLRTGATREALCRAYYRAYAGEAVAEVRSAAQRWCWERMAQGDFFIHQTRDELIEHRRNGAEVVLVSGSFAPVLEPIAAAVDANTILCTEVLAEADHYTGAIRAPMIGANKRAAVQALLAAYPALDPLRCVAYGDHGSDIDMLSCVGHPVAIGNDRDRQQWMAQRA